MNIRIWLAFVLNGFMSLVRLRIIFNIIFIALLLLGVSYLASQLVYGRQDRVVIHIGIAAISICMLFVAAFSGARLIQSDVDSRFAHVLLSRPVSRVQYMVGKSLGMILFLGLNVFLLNFIMFWIAESLGMQFSVVMLQSVFLMWIHFSWISLLALFLSQWMSTALTVMSVVGVFFISQNSHLLPSEFGGVILNLIPKGYLFVVDTRIAYDLTLTATEMFKRAVYGLVWCTCFMVLAGAFFRRKDI